MCVVVVRVRVSAVKKIQSVNKPGQDNNTLVILQFVVIFFQQLIVIFGLIHRQAASAPDRKHRRLICWLLIAVCRCSLIRILMCAPLFGFRGRDC